MTLEVEVKNGIKSLPDMSEVKGIVLNKTLGSSVTSVSKGLFFFRQSPKHNNSRVKVIILSSFVVSKLKINVVSKNK